jgi:hypothetical protein
MAMTDVSTYDLSYKLKNLQDRVERIEKERLEELEQSNERMRRKNEAFMRWSLFGIILIAAIVWSVVITLLATGH